MRGQVGKRSGLWFLLGVKEEEWCDILRKLPETWTVSQRQVINRTAQRNETEQQGKFRDHLDMEKFPFSRILSQY